MGPEPQMVREAVGIGELAIGVQHTYIIVAMLLDSSWNNGFHAA